MKWLLERFKSFGMKPFIYDDSSIKTYFDLGVRIQEYEKLLFSDLIEEKSVVAIVGDYCFETIALFLAVAKHKCIVVPITSTTRNEIEFRLEEGRVNYTYTLRNKAFELRVIKEQIKSESTFISNFVKNEISGLILFSSGSSGKPKAMIHDLGIMIDLYKDKKAKNLVFMIFLMFDHIGGLNTLLNSLAMGVGITIPKTRDPEHVCSLIEKYKVNVLPTSPTFLNLILLSESHKKFNLSSLKLITYGTEPMPESLLIRINEAFHGVKLLQTFVTSETGIAKVSSKSSSSNLIRFDEPDYEYKIVDNELWLKSKTQVTGYLNASNERFTEDGWFMTGDIIEQHEDGFFRVIGRNSDQINVGGLKVLPSEVETILLQIPLVADCLVYPEPNPITGHIVVAEIVPSIVISSQDLKKEIHFFCKNKIDSYKIPVRIKIVGKINYSNRFKKIRKWD